MTEQDERSEAAWWSGPSDPPRVTVCVPSRRPLVVDTEPMAGALLHCPVRGPLKAEELAADGLQFTEEKRRIDCIKFLLSKGYPASNIKVETVLLRFGHKGRSSLRTDVAVFDIPIKALPTDIEAQKAHIRLVAEIKRDNADAKLAKETQVKPAMDFLPDLSAHGIYWDDAEQRLFYKVVTGTKTKTHETAVALLPPWGAKRGAAQLTGADLRAANLRAVFERIEDRLHAEVPDGSARFEIMLQLLLAKLYDEHTHQQPKQAMILQDFTDSPLPDTVVKSTVEKLLAQSVGFYGKYLPKPVPKTVSCTGAMLRTLSAILAPVRIFGSKRAVVQDFYMYFAQGVYRWDMAQYFTPTEVVDFIVALVNPQAGDQAKDPACGSGDFLISTLHHAQRFGADMSDSIWGADHSDHAVQVCILNMVLNGDGKSNIRKVDSLVESPKDKSTYSVLLCNPPFGIKIVEKRFAVLQHFDLGHEWKVDDESACLELSAKVAKKQETGILFAELCVRQTEPGGRIGLILPNGYLGNQGPRYLALREWLLRHTRLVAVIGFPRFTFKKSGADVSASVLVLEKRADPLTHAKDTKDYPFHAGLLESVGWSAGDSRAEPIYVRDAESGQTVVDANNEPILNADFDRALREFRASDAAADVAWANVGIAVPTGARGHGISIVDVLARSDLSLDPKRWCARCVRVREEVIRHPHFKIGDVADVVDEIGHAKNPSGIYRYVEISNISDGVGMPVTMRGWELPERAKHGAAPGDLFVGGIWSSVDKWFVASGDCKDVRVTSGCRRLRLKKGQDAAILLDIIAGLNTETYRIQARAFCTGSDGLADLSTENLKEIVLPRIKKPTARAALQPYVDALLAGRATVASAVAGLVAEGKLPDMSVPSRSSHMVQV